MIVVDTNVLSELMRAEPDAHVLTWLAAADLADLRVTAISMAEIWYGVERLESSRRKSALAAAAHAALAGFADRVLPFDEAAAPYYGTIVARRERSGAPLDGFDGQIAAICASRSAVLATRNVKDFVDTGIVVANPWESA